MWNISGWLEKRKHCTYFLKRRQTKHQTLLSSLSSSNLQQGFPTHCNVNILKYFLDNPISPKQSGFRPGDSCINQLLSITHGVLTFFDNGLQVREVFLDISKAFDNVWHDRHIYKLKQNSINNRLICLLMDFLKNRQQKVVLNGQFSLRTKVNASFPQGSILEPSLFLVYINDLPNGSQSDPKPFAYFLLLFIFYHTRNHHNHC